MKTEDLKEGWVEFTLISDEKFLNTILSELHTMIDKKFGRTDRSKCINPYVLKAKITTCKMLY